MKAVTVIVLVTFLVATIGLVPAGAFAGVATAGEDTDDDKRDDRSKPPPQDNDGDRRPPREKPDRPDNDRDTRSPRERGQPPVYDRDDNTIVPLPERPICPCGRVYCDIHVYDYYPGDFDRRSGAETSVMVGIYGMAAATVMALNLAYTASDDRVNAGLGAAGVGLGWAGVVWSYNDEDPQNRRTLFLSGLFSIAFALIQYAEN